MCQPSETTRSELKKQLQSAVIVYLREESLLEESISELSRQLGIPRSTIYRRAWKVEEQLSQFQPQQKELKRLERENEELKRQLTALTQQVPDAKPETHIVVDAERVAMLVLELTARGSTTEDVKAALQTAYYPLKPPSDGTMNAIIAKGAAMSRQLMDQAPNVYPLECVEFDELYHANEPLLVMIEPYSMAIIFLESLGDARATSWRFATRYHGVELPKLAVHDCSSQGNAFIRQEGVLSQLCLWHRQREVSRELDPILDYVLKKALRDTDQKLWDIAVALENTLGKVACVVSPLDKYNHKIRDFETGKQQLLDMLQECVGFLNELKLALPEYTMSVPSLTGWHVRADQFVAFLRMWDNLADQVKYH